VSFRAAKTARNPPATRALIVTGDDFGLSPQINEAIERAHRDGILTSASLMVGSPACDDAVARARRNPHLRVGIHVVMVRGLPVLPCEEVRDLLDADGMLCHDLFAAARRWTFRAEAKQQLRAEVRAQFEKFVATGLTLDHIDSHNHMHMHPFALDTILEIGRDYSSTRGTPLLRVPYEPPLASWRAARNRMLSRFATAYALRPWVARMRSRARRFGYPTTDAVFGIRDSGAVTSERILGYLRELPDGLTEIYSHPSTEGAGRAELEGLLDPRVVRALSPRA